VINIFDYNFDGVICNYQITVDFDEEKNTYSVEFIIANNEIHLVGAMVIVSGQELKETDVNGKAIYYDLDNGSYNYIITYESKVIDEGVVVIFDSDVIKEVGFWSILQCDTAGIAYATQTEAYGLVFDGILNKGSDLNSLEIQIISSDTTSSGLGYELFITNNESIKFNKTGLAVLFETSISYVIINTDYRFLIWRNKTLNQYITGAIGTFVIYLQGKNKAITTKKYLIPNTDEMELVNVSGGSGSNPVTDNEFITSNFIVADLDAGDQISKIRTNGDYTSPYDFTVSTGAYSIIDEI
jgi:hypothetical protein